jgi:protein-S-isoprenylcysteine O-methyltransferase Ste14
MILYGTLLGLIWLAFIAVWFVSAFSAKRTIRYGWMGVWWRIAIAVAVVLAVHFKLVGGRSYLSGMVHSPALNILGLVLAAAGVALAIWARLYLGRNWGMPLSIKENPELVTTGPYAYIRNPIYTGVLLALLGSSLIVWWWTVIFVWAAIYFVFAARGEEKIMLREFPDQYPAYKARTKMLVPFVL